YGEPSPLNLICAHRSRLTPTITQLKTFLQSRCTALLEDYWLWVRANARPQKRKGRGARVDGGNRVG
ncbi:MAG: hypothetical protein ABI114_06255, partial [Rhodanobacter sp.]